MTNQIRALVARNEGMVLPAPSEWRLMADMSETLHASGLLPTSIRTPQAALAIMLKGKELGIPAMHALSNIVVINGKPTCNSELMLALVYRDHGDDALFVAETDAATCVISYKRRGWGQRQVYRFTIEDAKKANLVKAGPWSTYPAAMLRARAISAVARMAFPDSIGGMYTAEEVGATVELRDGEQVIIDSQPLPSVETPEDPLTALHEQIRSYEADDAAGIASIKAKYGAVNRLGPEQAGQALAWLQIRAGKRAEAERTVLGDDAAEPDDADEVDADVGSRSEELVAYVNDVDAHIQAMKGTRGPLTAAQRERWVALYSRGQALVGPATGEDARPAADRKPQELANACSRFVQAALSELSGNGAAEEATL